MESFESSKKSLIAYKGHFTRAVKAFDLLLKVKPRPTKESMEKSYSRVQRHLDALFTSADNLITLLESYDSTSETTIDVEKELHEINKYYETVLSGQCDIESQYVTFKESCTAHTQVSPTVSTSSPSTSTSSTPTVRLTALHPPSWNGVKADFYTWQRKFTHIMEEAKLNDELTQLCYLQNSRTLPVEYQSLISDCSTINEVWSRLKERVPKEIINHEIISQFRSLKPLSNKRTPAILRNFANEISLFCRRMSDLGLQRENCSCVIIQDVYERLGHDIAMRYRSKLELKQELMLNIELNTQMQRALGLETTPTALFTHESYGDLDSLCKFIRSKATTLELTSGPTQLENIIPPKVKLNIVHRSDSYQINNHNDDFVPPERYKCILGCETPHRLVDCSTYMSWDTEKRRSFIKSASRCYVFLVTAQTARNCPRKKGGWKYKFCPENNHHWTLCVNHNSKNENNVSLSMHATPFQPTMENNDANKAHTSLEDQIHSGHLKNMAISRTNGPRNVKTDLRNSEKVRPKDFSPMVVAEVRCNNGTWVQANCFLDTGSNSSLVRLKFAKQLRLQDSGVSDVRFDVAGGDVHHEQAEEFEICILPLHDDGRESYLILATDIKKPCSRVHPFTSEIFTSYEHLNEFRDKVHIRGGEVDLLIGNDYAPLIIAERCVSSPTSPDNSPSVAITRLGCYIYGYLNNPSSRAVNNILSINHANRIEDTEELKTFFYGDVIGVKPTSLCVCSDNQISESAFIKHVQETTVINEEGRVCVKMPWKPGFPRKLPNNYFMAKEQMIRREKQLLKDGKLEDYNQEIKSLLVQGVVRILNLEEAEKGPKESSWYLNHRMIERPDKESTKLRIVFNSAAKCMGVSLNDAFEKGPVYTNSLFCCFLRWRMYRVAVSGDMEKMFNQISIMEHDQRYHRFLWRYGDIDFPILTFQWLRVLFGDKPSPDLAGYAIRFLAENYKIVYPSGAEVLENSTYVDDIGYSVEDSKEAIKIAEEIDEILRHGKFSVKCWNSNGPNIDQYPNQIEVDVLGHTWNKEHDTIGVKPKELYVKEEDALTKRILMGLVARLWDPFGNLIPVTIKYRIHLQKIW